MLRTFFRNGRLTEIPMKQTKRRIVLERIALEFEPGRRYDEQEVNVDRRRVLQRPRGASSLPRRRGVPRPRSRRVLALRRPGRRRLSWPASVEPVRTRILSAASVLALATAIFARSPRLGAIAASGPCDADRAADETIQHFMKRKIRCAVDRFGPVPGDAERAICIAKRESGLIPTAESPTGMYLGLYQHAAEVVARPLRRNGPTPSGSCPTRRSTAARTRSSRSAWCTPPARWKSRRLATQRLLSRARPGRAPASRLRPWRRPRSRPPCRSAPSRTASRSSGERREAALTPGGAGAAREATRQAAS